jgi:hypothetical protein
MWRKESSMDKLITFNNVYTPWTKEYNSITVLKDSEIIGFTQARNKEHPEQEVTEIMCKHLEYVIVGRPLDEVLADYVKQITGA